MGNGALPHGPSYRAHPRLSTISEKSISARNVRRDLTYRRRAAITVFDRCVAPIDVALSGPSGLQLAIALQHIPTGIADSEAVGGQGGPAPKEIAPGDSLGAVAEPSGGGAARS
jgi:hypothetical protein